MFKQRFLPERFHQTDYRFSHVKAEDIHGHTRQVINVFGCLFKSLQSFAEDAMDEALPDRMTIDAYRALVQQNRGNEYAGMNARCFVLNHEHVANWFMRELSLPWRVHYVQIAYANGEVRNLKSTLLDQVNAEIEQHAVQGSNTHFRCKLFDPYPGLHLSELVSVRKYAVVKAGRYE